MNIIHFKAKKYLVDGEEDKYRCSRIIVLNNKEYLWLMHYKSPTIQFWYDPETNSKTEIPYLESKKSN